MCRIARDAGTLASLCNGVNKTALHPGGGGVYSSTFLAELDCLRAFCGNAAHITRPLSAFRVDLWYSLWLRSCSGRDSAAGCMIDYVTRSAVLVVLHTVCRLTG